MNKEEALAVMHEIYESCKESLTLTCVSLDAKQVERAGVGYQIRMKGDLDILVIVCFMKVFAARIADIGFNNEKMVLK